MREGTAAVEERTPPGGPGPPVSADGGVEELVDALCEIRCVLLPWSREQLVYQLPTRIRRNLRMEGSAVEFARNLVRLCLDQVRLGCLVRWILHLEEGGRSSREVARAAEPLLHAEEWEQLCHLLPVGTTDDDVRLVRRELREHHPDAVGRAFEAARPDRFALSEAPPRTAWDLLVDLAEMSVPEGGEIPLRVFCALLPAAVPLRDCADLVARWSGEGRDDPSAPQASRTPARLVVHVTQVGSRDRYDVEYWTLLSERRGRAPDFCDHGHAADVDPERIGDHVGGLLTLMEVDRRTGHHEGTRVELVGRLDLLRRLEAERWQEAGEGGRRLGARAEVVYRAEELVDPARGDTERARRTRARRWEGLEDTCEVLHLDTAHAAGERTRRDGRTYREPLAERLQSDRIVVLSVPSHLDDCHMPVWSAITIGVPVVVWRSANNGPGISPWLNLGKVGREVAVSPDRIRALPKALHQSRSGCVSPDDTGYIEESFEVAVFYHDSLPVLPAPRQMTLPQHPTAPLGRGSKGLP
ncbi:effector-associated domain 2-containing protein [Nocardiopsis halotolerans]|uniref:effector-associated domain 2-containing protein n=1 Tax=Nocardiopsis halotolerans TaxID=124252 RepID=UPI000346D8A1|nr:hypothetical protein [Nocardiopsis halotolerans]